jgi:hypothetical protein
LPVTNFDRGPSTSKPRARISVFIALSAAGIVAIALGIWGGLDDGVTLTVLGVIELVCALVLIVQLYVHRGGRR